VIRMVRPADDVALELTLRSELDRWMGVPYVLGGTTMRGVDCSGLVQRVFSDALDVPTPRTTDGMLRTGRRVNATALRVGDLVFFEPGGNYTHVGIYLGEDEFAHASSSNGVMISNLNESYWRRTYTTSRRLLEPGAGTPRPAEPVGTIRGVSSGPGW